MSAMYMLSFNGTELISGMEDKSKTDVNVTQKEALYYVIAVISFYIFIFLVLLFKYVHFKKTELDDTYQYFPLPSETKTGENVASGSGGDGSRNEVGVDKAKCHGKYGSDGVTPKATRVSIWSHRPPRVQKTDVCDV